jgi:capsular polysaccharide biosynthesis protein
VTSNESEVANTFARRGFDIIDPSKLSYAQQISLFQNADVIAGAHGSAFANLIWSRPGTKVIDLMPDQWIGYWGDSGIPERWVARLCSANHLSYSVLLHASQKEGSPDRPDLISVIDCGELNDAIDKLSESALRS